MAVVVKEKVLKEGGERNNRIKVKRSGKKRNINSNRKGRRREEENDDREIW